VDKCQHRASNLLLDALGLLWLGGWWALHFCGNSLIWKTEVKTNKKKHVTWKRQAL
jgi:hypothetical protein